MKKRFSAFSSVEKPLIFHVAQPLRWCITAVAICAAVNLSGAPVGIEILSTEYNARVAWDDPSQSPPSGFVSQTSSGEPISIAGGSPNAGGRISIDAFRMSLEQWHTVFESGNYALASVTGNSVWQFRSTNPHLFVDVEGSWFSQASEQQFELILRDITLNNVLFDFEGSEFIGGLNESLVFDADPTHVYELAMSTGANFVDLSGPRFSHVMGDVSVSMASAVPEQSSTGWLLALGLSGLLFMGRKHTPQELA